MAQLSCFLISSWDIILFLSLATVFHFFADKECLVKTLLRRIFWISLLFFIPLGVLSGFLLRMQPAESFKLPALLAPYSGFLPWAGAFFGLLCAVFFRIFAGFSAPKEPKAGKQKAGQKKKKAIAKEEPLRKDRDQRLFLHLLASLQKEARFLDFLAEDLDAYEDGQIGAAVRPVHENSRKTLERYLETQAVMAEEEGREIVVSEGFNPTHIKLVGKVSGDPPFHGILRHRGWRAKNIRIPVFSETKDSEVLAPAEVEVL